MDSTGALPSPSQSPIKSTKADVTNISVDAPQPSAWSSKTPQKPTQPARRHLTRRQPIRSVNQIREAAKLLRKSVPKPSVSPDLLPSVSETVVSKPKTSKPLPERYEMLNKLFTSLAASIRLLRLKQSSSTFTNISEKIETLTDSRFTYSHLAQLKFILPESIEIKKRLVRDEKTSCVKAELEVNLDFSIVQNDDKLTSDGVNLLMGKLFRSRLVSFWKSNPEGEEVPEFELPEPFNKKTNIQKSSIAVKKTDVESIQDTSFAISDGRPLAASHLPSSFKRRFSKHVSFQNEETVDQKSSELTLETPIKGLSLDKTDISSVNGTPVKVNGTPVKHISTPFSSTPAQSSNLRVRGFMTPDEESVMSPTKFSSNKLTRRSSSSKKSITFDTPVKSKTEPVKRLSTNDNDDDLYDILSDDLFSSIKEKEKKAIAEKDPAITQAKWRKQMISALPKLFDSLRFYFQSINRSVITKEELMHIIVSTQMEIVDRREVEEQLRLLQEIAPEWIYEKISSSGDLLICVNKISSSELIRTKLTEAI